MMSIQTSSVDRKRLRLGHWARTALTIAAFVIPNAAMGTSGGVVQVTLNYQGTNGADGSGTHAAVSGDGRFVAFDSAADDLVMNDSNGQRDVFLWDRRDGTVVVVNSTSADPQTTTADDESAGVAISPDGEWVAFNSKASNLPGANGTYQTFLWQRSTRTIEAVSVADGAGTAVGNGGVPSTSVCRPDVSADGRFVVFCSTSNNLVDDDRNSDFCCKPWQIFVRDRGGARTLRMTDPADPEDEEPNGNSGFPRISDDGSRVAFISDANDIPHADFDGKPDVFLWSGEIVRRLDSNNSAGITGEKKLEISGDGSLIAVRTPADLNGEGDSESDVFVHPWAGGDFENVTGNVGPGAHHPSVDFEGRYITYDNSSSDGQIWLHDREKKTDTKIVVNDQGIEVVGVHGQPEISSDGRTVMFMSKERLLSLDTMNFTNDVYIRSDRLDAVDPHPELANTSFASVVADRALIGEDGRLPTVAGVAADGATLVILRYISTGPGGTVDFELTSEAASNLGVGTLWDTSGSGGATTLASVPVESSPTGRHIAFAVWRAPEEFVRSNTQADCVLTPDADPCLEKRFVTVEAIYTPPTGDPVAVERDFSVHRPPVALIHGLWSDDQAFGWELIDDDRFTVYRHDYSNEHAEHFALNLDEPREAVAAATQMLRDQRIASTQADVFGHSMGGVLSRLYYANDPDALRAENFQQGDFNKLTTVDSPHLGSPLTCLLSSWANHPNVGQLVANVFRKLGHCIDCGAVEDLEPGSNELASVGAIGVPAHVIVGLGGRDILIEKLTVQPYTTVLNMLIFLGYPDPFDFVNDLFLPDLEHDLLVSQSSQECGLTPNSQPISIFEFIDSEERASHSSVVSEARVSLTAIDILNATSDNVGVFANGLPSTSSSPCSNIPPPPNPGSGLAAPDLTITEPVAGDVFAPGDLVTITVEPTGSDTFERVLIATNFNSEVVDTPPYSVTWTVPSDEIGDLGITVLAIDDVGEIGSATVAASTQPTDAVVTLAFSSDNIDVSGLDPQTQLAVNAEYEDGTVRDVSASAIGTTYTSSAPWIGTVDSEGLVTLHNAGWTVITAMLDDVSTTAKVEMFGPRLILGEAQPGQAGVLNTLLVERASAGGSVSLYGAQNEGDFEVVGCEMAPLGLDQPIFADSAIADSDGQVTFEISLPPGLAGQTVFFQAIEDGTCGLSGVTTQTLN